jgi:hypothetical protein
VVRTVSQEWIVARRTHKYRRTAERRIQTMEEARAFVNEVGFCHFWPIKGAELPNLFHAIAGRIRSVPMEHDDPDVAKCWGWKDEALGKRWWYYAKLLRKRATLISLDLLPAFYACSDNTGDLDDYLEEYRAGLLTAEAKWIFEALLEHGPLDTIELRRKARLSSERAKSRFDRALVELQAGLKVLPVGVARAGAWNYAFIYDIVQRHFPELAEQTREMPRDGAQRALVSRYIEDVIAANLKMIAGLFRVLKWTPTELSRIIARLLQEGTIHELEVDGLELPQLVSSRALDLSP